MKENNEYNDYIFQEFEEEKDEIKGKSELEEIEEPEEIEENQAGNNANSLFSKMGNEAVTKYADNVSEIIESKNKEYKSLKTVFGSDGELPDDIDEDGDFEDIDIPDIKSDKIDNDQKKELSMAIIIGGCLNTDRLKKAEVGKQKSGDLVSTRKNMVLDDVANGATERLGNLPQVLIDGKKDAANAINDLNNYKSEKASKMVDELIDFTVSTLRNSSLHDSVTDNTKGEVYYSTKAAMRLSYQFADSPLLKAGKALSEVDAIRFKAGKKMLEAQDKVFELKNNLLNRLIAEGYEDMVAELIFNEFIANISAVGIKERTEEAKKAGDSILEKIGLGPSKKKPNDKLYAIENLRNKNAVGHHTVQNQKLINAIGKYKISDIEVILAQDDGVEKLHELYMPEIKKSDIYKNMIKNESLSMADMMRVLDKTASTEGLGFFKNVKLTKAASAINEKYTEALKKEQKQIENESYDILSDELEKSVDTWMDPEEYSITSFDQESLQKNAQIMEDMLKSLNKVDRRTIRSSENFRNMKESLEELVKYSKKLSQNGRPPMTDEVRKYSKLVEETDKLASNYLYKKTNTDSDYAKSRMAEVFNLRRKLRINNKNFSGVYMNRKAEIQESEKEAVSFAEDMLRQELELSTYYNPRETSAGDPFRQGEYKDKDINLTGKRFTAGRYGAHSISMLALAAELENGKPKYTIDQIMDPKLLIKEKSAIFDEVMHHMTMNNEEGKKWIAEKMYYGYKNLKPMMDEYSARINYSDPKSFKTAEFRKINKLALHLFDAWQDMSVVKKQIFEVAKADNAPYKNYDEYSDSIASIKGPLGNYGSSLKAQYEFGKEWRTDGRKQPVKYVGGAIHNKVIQIIMEQAHKAGTPYTDIISLKLEEGLLVALQLVDEKNKFLSSYRSNPADIDMMIMDGTFTKDIKVEMDPNNKDMTKRVKISGCPDKHQLDNEVEYRYMDPKTIKAIAESKKREYDRKAAKASVDGKRYIENAKKALDGLCGLIEKKSKFTGEERVKAEKFIKDIIAEKCMGTFVKAGFKGQKLDAAIYDTLSILPEYKYMTSFIGTGTAGSLAAGNEAEYFFKKNKQAILDGIEGYKYIQNSEKILSGLENKNYQSSEKLVSDISKVFTAKIYKELGRLPENPETQRRYTFDEYAARLAKGLILADVANGNKSLNETASQYAAVAINPQKIKEIIVKTDELDVKRAEELKQARIAEKRAKEEAERAKKAREDAKKAKEKGQTGAKDIKGGKVVNEAKRLPGKSKG